MLKRIYFPLIATIATISLICLGACAFLYFSDNAHRYMALFLPLALTIIVSVIFNAFLLTRYLNQSTMVKNLRYENEYNFGFQTEFYNMDLFTSEVTSLKLRRINKHRHQCLIAFTITGKDLSQNNDRNQTIILLNGETTKILSDMFKGYKSSKDHTYCFDRGVFYLYCFGDDDDQVKSHIDTIKQRLQKEVEEHDVHIFIEPIFGYTFASSASLITEDVDNVNIARDVSERKFETITYYTDSMRKTATIDQTKDLMEALSNNEFVVYYQPKYNLASKSFTSSEALVRWNSPKFGLLPPSKFISIAESAGLIHEIDTFVFKKVCEDLNETKRRGRRLLPVSVNFSLYEFFSSTFLDVIMDLLEKYKVDPSLIQIEITETTSQANQFLSVSIIKKLKEKGIKILMDDFGVGFSNVGNFRKIPFDVIKIDKSFIDDIDTDPKAAEIVKFLIQLCKTSNMEVIAEGVDNVRQVEILKKYKCDTIQGFYYSKPLAKDEYEKFLANNEFEKKGVRAE